MENKKNKIKICCITSVDLTVRFILLDQLKFLKEEGYEVSAVCSRGKWVGDIERKGIKVKTIQIKREIFTPISDLIAFIKLVIYFRKENISIVHTHTPKAGILGRLAAKIAGVPIIIHTNHGFYFQEKDFWLKRKVLILTKKIAAKCSTAIYSVNRLDIKTAIEEKICGPDLIKYLGRDIDIEKFNPKRFSQEFILSKKKQLGINPNKKIIGIVGRMVEEKGYLELFLAFKEVLKRFPDSLLLIIGSEEPKKKDAINPESIKNYGIENSTLFLGQRVDVDELYFLMDIFVLPTHREGLGASILEASAMEKPVIATNVGGCVEAVNDGKTGILVPLKDPKKLAEAIMYLLSNPEVAERMGKMGRQKVVQEFAEKIVFSRMKEEYERLIKEKL